MAEDFIFSSTKPHVFVLGHEITEKVVMSDKVAIIGKYENSSPFLIHLNDLSIFVF